MTVRAAVADENLLTKGGFNGMITKRRATGLAVGLVALLLLAACSGAVANEQVPDNASPVAPTEPERTAPTDTAVSTARSEGSEREYQIITLLPPDAIPAIDDPQFYGVDKADEEYRPGELVLGVEIGGEARAYSVGLLSAHEIVNDTVAGQPIAVTW
jgi:hypothetical protein